MRVLKYGYILIGVLSLVSFGCGTMVRPIVREYGSNGYRTIVFESAAVGNKAENGGEVRLEVSLPDGYESSGETRYPVVYYCHGYGNDPVELAVVARALIQEAVAADRMPDVIIVGIQGTNDLGGSFYADSTAIGNWREMSALEAVPLIDSQFRTVPEPGMRMISGFSMGGGAAWNIALSYPDIFGSAFVIAPGAFDENGLRDAMPYWNSRFKAAYGAAFAPDTSAAEPSGQIPVFDGTESDNRIVAAWEQGFGGIENKLALYAEADSQLIEVFFVYGVWDTYPWIPRGTEHIAAAMKAAGISAEVQAFKAGHTISREMITEAFVPFAGRIFR